MLYNESVKRGKWLAFGRLFMDDVPTAAVAIYLLVAAEFELADAILLGLSGGYSLLAFVYHITRQLADRFVSPSVGPERVEIPTYQQPYRVHELGPCALMGLLNCWSACPTHCPHPSAGPAASGCWYTPIQDARRPETAPSHQLSAADVGHAGTPPSSAQRSTHAKIDGSGSVSHAHAVAKSAASGAAVLCGGHGRRSSNWIELD